MPPIPPPALHTHCILLLGLLHLGRGGGSAASSGRQRRLQTRGQARHEQVARWRRQLSFQQVGTGVQPRLDVLLPPPIPNTSLHPSPHFTASSSSGQRLCSPPPLLPRAYDGCDRHVTHMCITFFHCCSEHEGMRGVTTAPLAAPRSTLQSAGRYWYYLCERVWAGRAGWGPLRCWMGCAWGGALAGGDPAQAAECIPVLTLGSAT